MTVRKNKSIMVFILVVALFCGMVMFSPRVSAASSETANDTETLQAAFTNVDNNGTITVTSDIALTSYIGISNNNSFTLDLNSHTISILGECNIRNFGTGTITIKDSSTGGKGLITADSLGYTGIMNYSVGSIIVESGTIHSKHSCAMSNFVTGSIIIKGGNVSSEGSDAAIYNWAAGSIKISGGTIDASGEGAVGIMGNDEATGGEFYIQYGSSTIKGKDKAIKLGSNTLLSIDSSIDCVAYTGYNKSGKVTYEYSNLSSYKVLAFSPKKMSVTTSGLSYKANSATADGTINIHADIPEFGASNNYNGLDASGIQPDIGSVGTAGTDGSVADGSIVITLNKDYLNTLNVGTHKLVVKIKGGMFDDEKVSVNITVKKASNTPNTGDDQMIVVWTSMLILTACVGAIVIKKKKSSVN